MAKILLVEDNEMNRDMLARRLERRGYQVVIAIDGDQGVRLAQAERPDLILMDMSLPVLDGWEATRRLKADPDTGGIPVIALTAHAMSGDRQKALSAGCDDYDTKPVEFARLLGKIEKLLDGKPVALQAVGVKLATEPLRSVPALAPAKERAKSMGRVLVVDDTPANRDMLSRRLERHGFDVQSAEDGESALRLMSKADPPFDIVLLDVMMPGINGLDVLKAVRGRWDATELPVIMATARDASQDVVAALELG